MPLSARPPSQRATQRAACQATNASAPASVASSIASSERSDLGIAWMTVVKEERAELARLGVIVSRQIGHHRLGDGLDERRRVDRRGARHRGAAVYA